MEAGPLRLLALATVLSVLAGSFLFASPGEAASSPLGGGTQANHAGAGVPVIKLIVSALVASAAIGALLSLRPPRRRDALPRRRATDRRVV